MTHDAKHTRQNYVATLRLLLADDIENASEAADVISGLLTEQGLYEQNSGLKDWSYLPNGNGGWLHPVAVTISADYDRDDDTIPVDPRDAAPEMLVALQRAEFLLQRISEGDHQALGNASSAAAQARAAIAKAEGKDT